MPIPPAPLYRSERPNLARCEAATGRATSSPRWLPDAMRHPLTHSPFPQGATFRVKGTLPASEALSHPAAIVISHPAASRLALTRDEAERVGHEATCLEDQSDHGGTLEWWAAYVLLDIEHGARDRNGARVWRMR